MFPNQTDGYLKGITRGTATAGTTQTQVGATALTKGVTKVTTGTANDGVALPKADTNNVIGAAIVVENTSAAILKVYPYYDSSSSTASGGTVDGGAADAAFSQPASSTYLYVATAKDTWFAHKLS